MLDRIEADSTPLDRVVDGASDILEPEGLQEPQDLDELPLACLAQASFEQPPQTSGSCQP